MQVNSKILNFELDPSCNNVYAVDNRHYNTFMVPIGQSILYYLLIKIVSIMAHTADAAIVREVLSNGGLKSFMEPLG